MISDYFKYAMQTFSARKLRTGLTILGIFIGIAAVVSLISLSLGMQNAIDEQFKILGSNRVVVTPGGGTYATPATTGLISAKLYYDDLETVRRVKGVDHAIGVFIKSTLVEYEGEAHYAYIFAGEADPESIRFMQDIDYLTIEEGRYPKESEPYKAFIGPELGPDIFDEEINIGEEVIVKDQRFEVTGITKKSGNPIQDNKVAIPLETAWDLFDSQNELSSIMIETAEGFDPGEVAEDIKDALRRKHRVKEGDEDFSVQTSEQMIETFKSLLMVVQVFLVGISFISLAVGAVGIMNTMYTSVLERTREIGVMKAIGARNRDIAYIFLIEAGVLGVVGGLIGIGIGFGIAKIAEYAAIAGGVEILRVSLPIELFFGALLFSFSIGAMAGLFPALEASKKNPVESLRYRR